MRNDYCLTVDKNAVQGVNMFYYAQLIMYGGIKPRASFILGEYSANRVISSALEDSYFSIFSPESPASVFYYVSQCFSIMVHCCPLRDPF